MAYVKSVKKNKAIMTRSRIPDNLKQQLFESIKRLGSMTKACKDVGVSLGSIYNWKEKDKGFAQELDMVYPPELRKERSKNLIPTVGRELLSGEREKFLNNLKKLGNKAMSARLSSLNWGWLKRRIQNDPTLEEEVIEAMDEYAGGLYEVADKRAREGADKILMMLIKGYFPQFKEGRDIPFHAEQNITVNIGALADLSEEELESIVLGVNYEILPLTEGEDVIGEE